VSVVHQISGKLTENEVETFAIIRKLQAVGVKIPYNTLSHDIISKVKPGAVFRMRSRIRFASWIRIQLIAN
jgi:hypothetical protein